MPVIEPRFFLDRRLALGASMFGSVARGLQTMPLIERRFGCGSMFWYCVIPS